MDRSFLSIREVLDLLVDEFPDVTISKIRFLESKGLIHPERTPSGYRKFYADDVELLRWILLQQRENFLPLKVIKGRLEGASGADATPAAARTENGRSGAVPATPSLFDEIDRHRSEEACELVGVALSAVGERTGAAHAFANGAAASTILAPVTETVEHGEVGEAEVAAERTTIDNGTTALAVDPGVAMVAGDRPRAHPSSRPAPAAKASGTTAQASGRATRPEGRDAPPPAGESSTTGEAAVGGKETEIADDRAEAESADGPPEAATNEPPTGDHDTSAETGTGGHFSIEELSRAVGVDVAVIAELEDFGLLAGREVAGVHCYDEEGLVIARLAAGFRRFGLESRHLRTYKHAAEREAGLFSQVVTPLLRQRNPAARERAAAQLTELAALGAELGEALLRAALRELTGG